MKICVLWIIYRIGVALELLLWIEIPQYCNFETFIHYIYAKHPWNAVLFLVTLFSVLFCSSSVTHFIPLFICFTWREQNKKNSWNFTAIMNASAAVACDEVIRLTFSFIDVDFDSDLFIYNKFKIYVSTCTDHTHTCDELRRARAGQKPPIRVHSTSWCFIK